MPRRAPAARLADIDPHQIAREVTSRLAIDYAQVSRALGARSATCAAEKTPVYKRVHALASYAAHGVPLPKKASGPEAELGWLAALLHLVRLPNGEPRSPLEAVLVGARARGIFDRGGPLGASHLALLAGLDRDHVLSIAASLPGAYRSEERPRPWRFPVSAELVDWMSARKTQRVA